MKHIFTHTNFHVLDLERSIKFYEEALGLIAFRRFAAEDGSYEIAFMGDAQTGFSLELTQMKKQKEAYNLGDNKNHLAFFTNSFEESISLHKKMNCFKRETKNLSKNFKNDRNYFIVDPDGYWIEIIPRDFEEKKL